MKIFRFIRRKLIQDNQLGKYILYAAGEIILIIVGILIALQINESNAERKAQVEYQAYIEQLKLDVQTALSNSESVAEQMQEAGIRTRKIIEYLKTPEETSVDSETFKEAMIQAGRYSTLLIQIGNFGELLSGNLDMIYRNTELTHRVHRIQSELAVQLEVAYRLTRRIEDYQATMFKYQARQALAHFPVPRKDWKYDTEALASSREFLETVYSLSQIYGGYATFVKQIEAILKAFLKDLDELG